MNTISDAICRSLKEGGNIIIDVPHVPSALAEVASQSDYHAFRPRIDERGHMYSADVSGGHRGRRYRLCLCGPQAANPPHSLYDDDAETEHSTLRGMEPASGPVEPEERGFFDYLSTRASIATAHHAAHDGLLSWSSGALRRASDEASAACRQCRGVGIERQAERAAWLTELAELREAYDLCEEVMR